MVGISPDILTKKDIREKPKAANNMQRIPFDLLLIREKSFIFTNYYKSRGPDRTAVSMSPDSSIEILF